MRWLDSISDSVEVSLSKFWGLVVDTKAWCAVVHGVAMRLPWLSDRTEFPMWGFPGGAKWLRIHLPVEPTQEMQVRSLDQKNPLK